MTIDLRLPVMALTDERLQTTSFCLAAAHGARDDPATGGGIAHLLEHLLMSAPVTDGISFCEHVERQGGHANAQTGLDTILCYAQVHADDADLTAELLQRTVGDPQWSQDLLDGERNVVLQELTAAAADPSDVVQDAFLADLFGDQGLGRPVGGIPEELAALSLDDVRAAYHDGFLTAPMTLVVVGPRVPEPLVGAPSATADAARPASAVPVAPRKEVPRWPLDEEFCWVCCGGLAPRAGDPDRLSYRVLAKLLGSSPASLFYRAARNENGLSYAFQAWSRGYADTGVWRLLAGVEPRHAGQLVGLVKQLLDQMAHVGPTPAELEIARRQACMSMVLDWETPLERAKLVAQRIRAGRPAWSLTQELKELDSVTVDDVRRAAGRIADDLRITVRPEPR
ncbi:M16 family metallopeptidase [Streptomyces coffeae]|uniref:Insulinase family protein n=1 Tax=Streptomyces coffeae TaxID=621382 RepID=A0ABS1NDF0_9ACTN|nr:pitrilysin family protein [Streptomyces coffeae]MBL1097950.1 insulinase family protein [Streptomyces coffeae]